MFVPHEERILVQQTYDSISELKEVKAEAKSELNETGKLSQEMQKKIYTALERANQHLTQNSTGASAEKLARNAVKLLSLYQVGQDNPIEKSGLTSLKLIQAGNLFMNKTDIKKGLDAIKTAEKCSSKIKSSLPETRLSLTDLKHPLPPNLLTGLGNQRESIQTQINQLKTITDTTLKPHAQALVQKLQILDKELESLQSAYTVTKDVRASLEQLQKITGDSRSLSDPQTLRTANEALRELYNESTRAEGSSNTFVQLTYNAAQAEFTRALGTMGLSDNKTAFYYKMMDCPNETAFKAQIGLDPEDASKWEAFQGILGKLNILTEFEGPLNESAQRQLTQIELRLKTSDHLWGEVTKKMGKDLEFQKFNSNLESIPQENKIWENDPAHHNPKQFTIVDQYRLAARQGNQPEKLSEDKQALYISLRTGGSGYTPGTKAPDPERDARRILTVLWHQVAVAEAKGTSLPALERGYALEIYNNVMKDPKVSKEAKALIAQDHELEQKLIRQTTSNILLKIGTQTDILTLSSFLSSSIPQIVRFQLITTPGFLGVLNSSVGIPKEISTTPPLTTPELELTTPELELNSKQANAIGSIVGEIRTTEEKFTTSLSLVVEALKNPEGPQLPEEVKKLIQPLLEELLNAHTQILNKLPNTVNSTAPGQLAAIPATLSEESLADSEESLAELKKTMNSKAPQQLAAIPAIFSDERIAELIKTHTKFAMVFDTVLNEPSIQEFMGQTLGTTGLKFSAHFLTPIQRLPRYVLLLKELNKNTPENTSTYTDISACLGKFKTAMDSYNANTPK